jgi:Zn-dependent M28 family amino/carboxypeptidase
VRRLKVFSLVALGTILIGLLVCWTLHTFPAPVCFNGQRAYQDVLTQVAFGARIPDSQAHAQTIAYIQEELQKAGWQAEVQETQWRGFSVQNIVASRTDESPQVILGAHYDSRILADQDPGPGRNEPVPGANDGASGVAILLELARTLPSDSVPAWLVFLDAEDNGGLDGRDWIMGSRAFVATLTFRPRAVIIVDMVGDADLNLYIEHNSDAALSAKIWAQAARLGYKQQFIQTAKYSMLDDHTPFLEAGIPAVDVIDFDYPYWHTAADTPDKVSPKSLQIVGETLRTWILTRK